MAGLLPLAAIYFGRRPWRKSSACRRNTRGRGWPRVGIGLGAGLGILLSGWLIFGGNEVPHGYQVLDYSDLEPDPERQDRDRSAGGQELSDKKTRVYVRGYILPGRRRCG